MSKLKTHKATAKRFKITKNKKVIQRTCGQNHFNARESGNVTRSKRSNHEISKSYQKTIKILTNTL